MSVPFVVLRRFLPQAAEGHPDIFTKEKIMRKRFVGNYVKVAVIAVSLAVASSCALAGTFAAFSATYTWRAESVEAGDVAYRNTDFSLDLFDDGYILPGDSGSAEITGVDFGDMSVAWSFDVSATEDGRVIPVVFYVSEDGKIVDRTYYSAHNFSEHGGYLSVGGKYIPASSVSTDATGITAALGTGKSVCWAWPDTIYTDQSGTVDEVALKDYQDYCAKVCDVSYAYTVEAYGDIFELDGTDGTVTPIANVFAMNDNGLEVLICKVGASTASESKGLGIKDGLFTFDGKPGYVETAGRFEIASSSSSLTRNSRVWLLVPVSQMTEKVHADLSDIGAEIGENYSTTADAEPGEEAIFVSAENGNRTLVKLPPVQTGVRASVSVTVSAVVTF